MNSPLENTAIVNSSKRFPGYRIGADMRGSMVLKCRHACIEHTHPPPANATWCQTGRPSKSEGQLRVEVGWAPSRFGALCDAHHHGHAALPASGLVADRVDIRVVRILHDMCAFELR